jgi:hypothetical protein
VLSFIPCIYLVEHPHCSPALFHLLRRRMPEARANASNHDSAKCRAHAEHLNPNRNQMRASDMTFRHLCMYFMQFLSTLEDISAPCTLPAVKQSIAASAHGKLTAPLYTSKFIQLHQLFPVMYGRRKVCPEADAPLRSL